MDVDVEIPFRRMSYKEAMDKYAPTSPIPGLAWSLRIFLLLLKTVLSAFSKIL